MKHFLLVVIAIFAMFVFISCNNDIDTGADNNWEKVGAGWEKTVSYKVGDKKAQELQRFLKKYKERYGNHKKADCDKEDDEADNNETPEYNNTDEDKWKDNETTEEASPYTCYASNIYAYNPGTRSDGSALTDDRNDPTKALGEAQNNDTKNFVALGFGGSLILEFDGVVINQDGNDLKVFETSYGNPTCEQYTEKVKVLVSKDAEEWIELGITCQDGEFDLGNLEWIKYVKLVDVTNPDDFSAVVDGFDVDAVEAMCSDANQGDYDDVNDDGCENDWMVPGGENGEGCYCEDELDTLNIEISVEYLNPNAPPYQGYPNYWMGSTVEYTVTIENTGDILYQNLEVSALFEYASTNELLAGEPVQVWENVNIPANDKIVLTDTYFLSFDNIPTFFQTHVLVRKITGRCTTGVLVFDEHKVGIFYDPVEE